jgi:hypothetical protein
MKMIKIIILGIVLACAIFITNTPLLALQPPVLESVIFNTSYDFLQDLTLDDLDVIWKPVAGAADYKVLIYFTGAPHEQYWDEFVIPRDQIVELINGSLKFLWTEYEANHPRPMPYPISEIAIKAVDSQGNESAASNLKGISISRTVIYGKITDSLSLAPIPGARIDYRQWDPDLGGWTNQGVTSTNSDGMYYIIGLPYVMNARGADGDTRLDISQGGYETSLDNQAVLTEYAKVIRKDAGLTAITIPSAPSDLKATVIGARYVKLRWRDNSNSETGFRIERKAGTGKYTLIRIVGANTTVSLDKNLTRGKVYYYRVSAKNRTGKSAYSNVAAVRIPY